MQNNPLNTLVIKDNITYKKDPANLKLSLLKQKISKAKKLNNSNSSNENTILKYYPEISKTTNDKYSLKEEDATIEQLIFKTKRVKLVSGSDNNSDTSKLIYENFQGVCNTERSRLVKPSKIRKISNTPKNAFIKVLNSPESLVEPTLEISKSINKNDGDHEPRQLIAKGPKKQKHKLYSESIFDNTDLEKHTEVRHVLETSEPINKNKVPDHFLLKDKGPKKQRHKSYSQLIFNVTDLKKDTEMYCDLGTSKLIKTNERDPDQNQFIDKVSKKRKRKLYSETIFNDTNLERKTNELKSVDEYKNDVNTENPRLIQKTTTKKASRKSESIKKRSLKKNKVTVNNTVLESDLITSKLINGDDNGVDDMEMSQLSIKQLKKRQRSKSCSRAKKIPCITDIRKTLKIDSDRNQLKAIIDDYDMKNDTDTTKVIDEDGIQDDKTRSSQLVAEKPKKVEELNSNKIIPLKNVKNSKSMFEDFNDHTRNTKSIMATNGIKKSSKSDNGNYEEYTEQNHLIIEQTKKQESILNKSSLQDTHTGNEPATSKLIENNDKQDLDEQQKNRGRPILDSSIANSPKNFGLDSSVSKLFDKDDKQENVELPKKRGRKRLDSSKATTPKIITNKDIESDTFTLLDKDDNQESVEQPKKRGRPRLYSVKDTTPKTTIQKELNKSESLVSQNTHFDKDDEQESVEQPKKRGRPRLNSSKATTPKKNTKNYVEPDTTTIFDKDDKNKSIEQPKKRGRPRLYSVKDTTPKTTTQKELNKSESLVNQNNHIQTKEVTLNNSELDNCDINANNNRESVSENERTSVTPELLQPSIQKGNGYATKRVTPRTASKTLKINLAKTKRAMLKPNGKITKESLKATSFRKIPQNRLENALEMLRNEDHPVWEDQNLSCNTGIFRYWEPRNCIKSDRNLKIKYARQFLLRRDWINLSKVLSLSTSNVTTNRNNHYYPLLTKYATLCLAHTDKEQFNKFVQFLVGLDDGTSTSVMKKCTNIMQESIE